MKYVLMTLALVLVISLILVFRRHKSIDDPVVTDTQIINPPQDYWFWRSDGTGKEFFQPENGVYLRQTIKSPAPIDSCDEKTPCKYVLYTDGATCREKKCATHVNSEIYNNPCCSGEVDKMCAEWITSEKNDIVSATRAQSCKLFKSLCNSSNVDGNYSSWTDAKCYLRKAGLIDAPFSLSQAREPFLNLPYLYCNMKITMKVDNASSSVGSRGWGFWDTGIPAQCIWFMNSKGRNADGTPYTANGFSVLIAGYDEKGKYYVSGTKLPDLDDRPHDYEITWTKNKIEFIIDGKTVFSESQKIPNVNMNFHSWVDNVVYAIDKDGNTQFLFDFFEGTQSQDILRLEITQN